MTNDEFDAYVLENFKGNSSAAASALGLGRDQVSEMRKGIGKNGNPRPVGKNVTLAIRGLESGGSDARNGRLKQALKQARDISDLIESRKKEGSWPKGHIKDDNFWHTLREKTFKLAQCSHESNALNNALDE